MSEDIIRGLLKEAIALAGSQAKLAKMCERRISGKLKPYSQNAIYVALRDGVVSPTLAVCIERATKGAIRSGQLCPILHKRPRNPAQPTVGR